MFLDSALNRGRFLFIPNATKFQPFINATKISTKYKATQEPTWGGRDAK